MEGLARASSSFFSILTVVSRSECTVKIESAKNNTGGDPKYALSHICAACFCGMAWHAFHLIKFDTGKRTNVALSFCKLYQISSS